MKVSGWISTFCVIIGIFIPGVFIVTMGIIWLVSGNPSNITFSWAALFPHINSVSQMTILPVILLIFGGLEMSAVHAKDVEKPQKNYPKAIGLSAIIIFGLLSLGALSIAVVVPKDKIELASGSIEAIRYFLSFYHIEWVMPILICLMVIGALGMISTWLIGPPKGILATAKNGDLPPLLQKTNKKNMPVAILVVQAIVITFLSLIFLYMPTVSSTYSLLLYLTAQCYLIMYVLLFISGIVLRYKKPKVPRYYKVPFGNVGMWIVSMVGLASSSLAMFFGFFPPVNFKNSFLFTVSMVLGTIIMFLIPLMIHRFKKPSWHAKE
jgi:amino acid transporter